MQTTPGNSACFPDTDQSAQNIQEGSTRVAAKKGVLKSIYTLQDVASIITSAHENETCNLKRIPAVRSVL